MQKFLLILQEVAGIRWGYRVEDAWCIEISYFLGKSVYILQCLFFIWITRYGMNILVFYFYLWLLIISQHYEGILTLFLIDLRVLIKREPSIKYASYFKQINQIFVSGCFFLFLGFVVVLHDILLVVWVLWMLFEFSFHHLHSLGSLELWVF